MHGDGDCSGDHDQHHYTQRHTQQIAHKEVSWLAINAKFKKTGENSLVKCDQKVNSNVAMTEFKKTGEDSQCNVESPLVELGLRRQTTEPSLPVDHQHHI
jgi:hypothetical protein